MEACKLTSPGNLVKPFLKIIHFKNISSVGEGRPGREDSVLAYYVYRAAHSKQNREKGGREWRVPNVFSSVSWKGTVLCFQVPRRLSLFK